MKQTIIPMKMDTKIVLNIGGDLYLEGFDQSTFIAVVDDGDTFRMKEENNMVYVRSNSDCKITVPDSVIATIERVNGDCSARNLKNRMVIGRIDGDLSLRSIGGASIENVGGDCVIKDLNNNLEIARVGGDLVIDQSGQLLVSNVGGDLDADNIVGKVESNVGGDVDLRIKIQNIPEINLRAGGDIHLLVPEGANAILDLSAGGEISIQTVDQKGDFENSIKDLALGSGGASVRLRAGGDIRVSDQAAGAPDFGKVFSEFDSDWNDFAHDIEYRVKKSMEKAMLASNYAARRAEDLSRAAQEKLDRAMRKLDERGIFSERDRKYTGFSFEKRPSSPAAPKPGVSEEERMLILKMLQDKKITVEEAEKLLKALEG